MTTVITYTDTKHYKLWRDQIERGSDDVATNSFEPTFSASEGLSYREEMRRLQEEDPEFFKQLITGDTR